MGSLQREKQCHGTNKTTEILAYIQAEDKRFQTCDHFVSKSIT
jgi:hypothetical protein